jgi:4-oxalocrotonate tautomerase
MPEKKGSKYSGSLPETANRELRYFKLRREIMPFVNIKITREGATREQKEKLIKGATDLLVDVLGKNPATTVVVIEEVETDNWGIGGESVTTRRQKG